MIRKFKHWLMGEGALRPSVMHFRVLVVTLWAIAGGIWFDFIVEGLVWLTQ